MTLVLRQAALLATLIVRYWMRAGLPSSRRNAAGRRASSGLLRLTFFVAVLAWGQRAGAACLDVSRDEQPVALLCLSLALFGIGTAWSALARVPWMRQRHPSPTQAPLLDTLPLTETSRVLVGLGERIVVYALAVPALVAAASTIDGLGRVHAAALAVALATSSLLLGDALVRGLRTKLLPERVARLSGPLFFVYVVGFVMLAQIPSGARWLWRMAWVQELAPRAAVTLAKGGGLAVCAFAAVFAVGLLRWAERRGYDRIDIVPMRGFRRVPASALTQQGLEAIVSEREPGGGWARVFLFAFSLLASVVLVFVLRNNPADSALSAETLLRACALVVTSNALSGVQTRANRMVDRDAAARPLLAPLGVLPRDSLAGKTTALVRQALASVVPFFLLLLAADDADFRYEILWRGSMIAAAVTLASSAVVSVAFLTQGLGSRRPGGGGGINIDTMLVAAPLIGVVVAATPGAALMSTLTLGLVAFEARRSALGCVQWADDGDEAARDTPVWRAILAFAAFQVGQTLAQRALAGLGLHPFSQALLGYSLAALLLLALMMHARRERPSFRVFPERPWWLLLGCALGVLTAWIGMVYVGTLQRWQIDVSSLANFSLDSPEGSLMLMVSLGLAPALEESFFRGWLQASIFTELPVARRWLAPLLGATVFALAHPTLSFPVMLLLGLFTGTLFQRTSVLGPGLCAHLAHNLVVAFAPLWRGGSP